MTDEPTQHTPRPEPEARVLGGRYELGRLVGRGGMADVHLGHDLRLGRTVAIKMLRTDLARDSSFLARFRREAQSAAGLNHPAIVSVFDSGETEVTEAGGAPLRVPYIIMEYVEGRTLREVLNEEKQLDPDEAARITASVLAALEYAHDRSLVHRDIKPANVMVTPGGAVKVMDFGIARALADTAATMTQTQAVMGTARYLSPEQAQGLDVDGRSDLYSVGCLLYELLAGRTPFQGDPVSLVYQHLGEAPKAPSTHLALLPQALDAITLHALEKRPEDRYQNAAQFRADLNAARADEPVSLAARTTYDRVIGAAAVGAGAALGEANGGEHGWVPGFDEDTGTYAAGPTRGGNGQGNPRPTAYGTSGDPTSYDDGYERTDELPVREERHPGAALLLGTLALLAVAGVSWVLFQVFGPGQDIDAGPTMLDVPSTLTMTESEARQLLTETGFTVPDPADTQNSDQEIGTVIAQDPPGGVLAEGSAVRITLSAGPESRVIPPVRGMQEDEARNLLTAEGFTNVRVAPNLVDDPDWARGLVIDSAPTAGQAVSLDTQIVLEVSSGKVEVPEVVGELREVAVLLLSDQSLEWDITEQRTAEAAPGTVIWQGIEPGQVVDQDTVVDLVVAQELLPTTTATVTVEPPPTSPDPTDPTETTDPPDPTDDPTDDPPDPTDDPTDPTDDPPDDPPDPTLPDPTEDE